MCNVDFKNFSVWIDNVLYIADVPMYYDTPWDYYIVSEDIYIRAIGDPLSSDPILWALFKGKGNLSELSWEDLFNTHKIWTPYISPVYNDCLVKV